MRNHARTLRMALPSENLQFWEKRWEEGKTAWHKNIVDPVLEKRVGLLEECGDGSLSILVTMCGKSIDLLWLCSRGHNVVGVEGSSIAVGQLFTENSIPHTVVENGAFSVYTATDRNLKVFCGDMFKFGPSMCSDMQFDAIWDCNAIVAVNTEDRNRYARLLVSLLKQNGRILMTTWTYDQTLKTGFPKCMPPDLINDLFSSHCDSSIVDSIDMMANSKFLQRHNLPWATRPVILLTKK